MMYIFAIDNIEPIHSTGRLNSDSLQHTTVTKYPKNYLIIDNTD